MADNIFVSVYHLERDVDGAGTQKMQKKEENRVETTGIAEEMSKVPDESTSNPVYFSDDKPEPFPLSSPSVVYEKTVSENEDKNPVFDREAYYKSVRERINDNTTYPSIARARGIKGSVVLEFTLNPDGSLKNSRISVSSGFSVLDKEAQAILRRSAPFSPSPAEMQIILPVVFDIR